MFDVPVKFYELCRLCLSSDGVKVSIFEEEGKQRNFAEKIHTCLALVVRTHILYTSPTFTYHFSFVCRRIRTYIPARFAAVVDLIYSPSTPRDQAK